MTESDGDSSGGFTSEQYRPTHLADESELEAFCTDESVALVEFYTNGCGICQSMEPVLGNVAQSVGIPVGLINPRDDPPLVDRFDVRRVPLLVVFVDGEPVARRDDGFVSGDDLSAWLFDVLVDEDAPEYLPRR